MWNRLTNFSLGFALAIASFTLGLTNRPREALTPYFTIVAVVLLAAGIFIEGVGIRRTRHFSMEDAQEVYQRVTQLIKELRALASILHRDYDGLPNSYRRYNKDERYEKLMKEFNQVMMKCDDYALYKKLSKVIESEKLMTKYRLTSDKSNFPGVTESADQDIRDYVRTKFRSQKVVENDWVSANCSSTAEGTVRGT